MGPPEKTNAEKMSGPGELLEQLRLLYGYVRDEYRQRFHRSVPFADQIVDRWERATFLGFGPGASIYDSALVLGDVHVGNNTWVGPGCILDGSGGLTIGNYCSIAAGCHLYSHDSVEWALSGGKAPYVPNQTIINDCCYLGPHAVVTAGVKIGKHCLIGALTLVKADVPDFSIAAGIPARIIGHVELTEEHRVRLIYQSAA